MHCVTWPNTYKNHKSESLKCLPFFQGSIKGSRNALIQNVRGHSFSVDISLFPATPISSSSSSIYLLLAGPDIWKFQGVLVLSSRCLKIYEHSRYFLERFMFYSNHVRKPWKGMYGAQYFTGHKKLLEPRLCLTVLTLYQVYKMYLLDRSRRKTDFIFIVKQRM